MERVTDLWDDERGIVHQVVRRHDSAPGVWRIVCSDVIDKLHVGSRRCVVVTCLWCIQGARGPWFSVR